MATVAQVDRRAERSVASLCLRPELLCNVRQLLLPEVQTGRAHRLRWGEASLQRAEALQRSSPGSRVSDPVLRARRDRRQHPDALLSANRAAASARAARQLLPAVAAPSTF